MKSWNKLHEQQLRLEDNGFACLKSILKSFGTDASIGQLRNWGETEEGGVTFLGLLKAARMLGLKGKGYRKDIDFLKKSQTPSILHIIKQGSNASFCVFYSYDERRNKFWIGDPEERNVKAVSEELLSNWWHSKYLLYFEATEQLKIVEDRDQTFREWFKELLRPEAKLLKTIGGISFLSAIIMFLLILVGSKAIADLATLEHSISLTYYLVEALFLIIIFIALDYAKGFFVARQRRDFTYRLTDCFLYSKTIFKAKGITKHRLRLETLEQLTVELSHNLSNILLESISLLAFLLMLCYLSWSIGLIALLSLIPAIYLFNYSRPVRLQRGISLSESYEKLIETRNMGMEFLATSEELLFDEFQYKTAFRVFQNQELNAAIYSMQCKFFMQLLVFLFGMVAFALSIAQTYYGSLSLGNLLTIQCCVFIFLRSQSRIFRQALDGAANMIVLKNLYNENLDEMELSLKEPTLELKINTLV